MLWFSLSGLQSSPRDGCGLQMAWGIVCWGCQGHVVVLLFDVWLSIPQTFSGWIHPGATQRGEPHFDHVSGPSWGPSVLVNACRRWSPRFRNWSWPWLQGVVMSGQRAAESRTKAPCLGHNRSTQYGIAEEEKNLRVLLDAPWARCHRKGLDLGREHHGGWDWSNFYWLNHTWNAGWSQLNPLQITTWWVHIDLYLICGFYGFQFLMVTSKLTIFHQLCMFRFQKLGYVMLRRYHPSHSYFKCWNNHWTIGLWWFRLGHPFGKCPHDL